MISDSNGRADRLLATGLALGLAACLISAPAAAQTVGFGASPGRAAYRTPGQWNDGPFYTAPHWDPYAPRAAINSGLQYEEASLPPYASAPHAQFGSYSSGRGTLYSYQQGFSPYSGYSSWYKKEYGLDPTRSQLAGAANQYFRSSPIPADPRYLAPGVSQALYGPAPAPTPRVVTRAPAAPATAVAPRVEATTPAAPHRPTVYIYRGPG